MKRTWQCPKCTSLRVGYLETLADGGQGSGDRRIGYASGGSVFGLEVSTRQGRVEAFVCTDCGYFEEYVANPQAIPWDKMNGFRWCRPETAGMPPYR